MKAHPLVSIWVCGWSLLALCFAGLSYAEMLNTVGWWVLFACVLLPAVVFGVFAAVCGVLDGVLASWQWFEERAKAEEQRRESQRAARIISVKFREIRSAREQREKEGAESGL